MDEVGNPDRTVAYRVTIGGIVQGVGFRPYVYRVAETCHLVGWVINDAAGVEIHIEGRDVDASRFLDQVQRRPPVAARIDRCFVVAVPLESFDRFEIRQSQRESAPTVPVAADLAVCTDCLRELRDPANRRCRYPYINCAHCGPRYSIVRRLPYDRLHTTMAAWPLCAQCQSEYEDPFDRRYHAQATTCGKSGPNYRLVIEDVTTALGLEAITATAELLRNGKILAIKGIGGYHLACDALNAEVVLSLRRRKFRKDKPFAVMVPDLTSAGRLVELTQIHEDLLMSSARPIVLAPARKHLPGVAPDTDLLGVMLPYSPLHHLLFDLEAPVPLVLSSANRSHEPIAYRDEEAFEQLAGIADGFLLGERSIARRVDDSVVAVRAEEPFFIRRARGYAPSVVLKLPTREPILALGGDLKNTIALVVEGKVIVSQHIGDLDDDDTRTAFCDTVRDLLAMYDLKPEEMTVAHDMHPELYSTRFAELFVAKRRIAVQHHHAHIAGVLAEHGLFEEDVIGIAMDGTGYGLDGSIWGGELFAGSLRKGFSRELSLRPVDLPGGDAAARFPVQAAAGYLATVPDLPKMTAPPFDFPGTISATIALSRRKIRSFRTTSAGRLFDAVAALTGFIRPVTYEGQAANWLEHQAGQSMPQPGYRFPNLDWEPLITAILADRRRGRPVREIAYAFHAGFAAEVARHAYALCLRRGTNIIAFSGGVFQNELLLTLLRGELFTLASMPPTAQPLRLLTHRAVPVNDGGLCVGQAAFAACCEA